MVDGKDGKSREKNILQVPRRMYFEKVFQVPLVVRSDPTQHEQICVR